MNFHVINLGCKVNRAESDLITARLLNEGHQVSALSSADTIIINTCTVTGDAEKKTRKTVRRALRENSHASVLVTGCAAVIDPDLYRTLDARVQVLEKASLISSEPLLRVGEEFPLRVPVKVQDGCDHACAYCIVHIARGRAWSRPISEIIAEVHALEATGIREIMLSGIDLGSYDFEGTHLDGLLETLLGATDTLRFRISSIEPCSLQDSTIALIADAHGRICRHLHVPLQSGSNKVLFEMNRPYSADFYKNLIRKLYEKIPEISLSTDIIVGFPGESDDEFKDTLALAKLARFSKIHAFRYSKREGTPAAKRKDQIDPAIKDKRLKKLLDLGYELRAEDAQRRIGTNEKILVEAPGIGMSESYHKVLVPKDIAKGELISLALTGLDSFGIIRACKNE